MTEHPEACGHVGLLVNKPPGTAELLFIQSSDNLHFWMDPALSLLPPGPSNSYMALSGEGKGTAGFGGYRSAT